MLLTDDWKDYELIDTGGGEKLERWGDYILRRPDPQVIWPVSDKNGIWKKAHARYHRSTTGGGKWEYHKNIPERWIVRYRDLSFYVQLTGFKHTGLFPEQAVNWNWITDKIKSAGRSLRVLNLFAYTGSLTAAAASAGAEVCHVDAAKGMVARAKDNVALSGLPENLTRFITDDVIKFVEREGRRGKKYDAVIMDPPSYGRGPKGETWKLEDELYGLIEQCINILSEKPYFFLVNSYTTGLSPTVIKNILSLLLVNRYGGTVFSDEIGLPVKSTGLVLPCGSAGRWEM
jgi:23S rRNA (cytosine1962-C5)-methyltransferase